ASRMERDEEDDGVRSALRQIVEDDRHWRRTATLEDNAHREHDDAPPDRREEKDDGEERGDALRFGRIGEPLRDLASERVRAEMPRRQATPSRQWMATSGRRGPCAGPSAAS